MILALVMWLYLAAHIAIGETTAAACTTDCPVTQPE